MINPEKAVKIMKEEYPILRLMQKSDHDIYEDAMQRYPDLEFAPNPYIEPTYKSQVVSNMSKKDINEADHSPDAFKKLLSMYNLADKYAETGLFQESMPWLGLTPEFFQNASNENLSGLIYSMKEGKLKHNVGDYEQGLWEDVAQFFVGIANPVDLLAFGGSGGVGGVLAKKWGQSLLTKKFITNSIAGSFRHKLANNPATLLMAESIAGGGIGLGSYMAAAGSIGETSKQSIEIKNPEFAKQRFGDQYIERDEYNVGDIVKTGVAHGSEGAALGMVTAGTGKFIGNRFRSIRKATDSKFIKKSAKLLNIPTQVAVEALEFATIPYAFHGGPESAKQFYRDYIHSLGIIGPLKASTAFFRSSHSEIKEHMNAVKTQLNAKKKALSQSEKSIKNTKNEIESDIPTGEKNAHDKITTDSLDKVMDKDNKLLYDLLKSYEDVDKSLSSTIRLSDKLEKEGKLSIGELKQLTEDGVMSYNFLDGWAGWMEKDLKEQNPSLYGKLTKDGELKVNKTIAKNVKDLRDNLNRKVTDPDIIVKEKIKIKGDREGTAQERVEYWESSIENVEKRIEDAKNQGLYKGDAKQSLDQQLSASRYELDSVRKKFKDELNIVEDVPTPEEHIIGGVNLEEAKIDWTDTKIKSEAKRLGVDYKILKKEIVDKDKIIERIFKQDIAEEFKFQRGEEQQADRIAERILGYSIKESRRTAKKTINENKLSQKRYNELKGKVKGDDALAVAEFQSASESKGTYAKPVGDFLIWLKKDTGKSLKDSKAEDIHRYFQEVILERPAKHQISSGDVAAFSKFDKWAKKKWNADRLWEDISYTEANLNRYENVVDRHIPKNLAEHLRSNYEGARQIVAKTWKGTTEAEFDFVYDLMHRGLRPSEINRINKVNFKQHTDGTYYIDLTTRDNKVLKSQSGGRLQTIIIPEKLYKYGLKINKSLFEIHGKGGKLLQNRKTNAKKSMQKLIAEKLTGDSNASVKDMRNAFEQLKISIREKDLTQQELDMYLGHDITGQKLIYKLKDMGIDEAIGIARKVEKALGVDSGSGKYQFVSLGKSTLDASVKAMIETHMKRYPSFKVVYEKDKAYAGKIFKNVIHLTEGKANLQTFFHEIGHGFEAFIRETGDKELIKLWERGEKMYSKEAKKSGLTANEFFTDRVSDYGVGMSVGIRNKIASWSKLMMTKLKKLFFGKSNLNKRDIARLLGEKAYKGFGTENTILLGERPKFKIESRVKFRDQIKSALDDVLERTQVGELSKRQKKEFIEVIARKAGIENPAEFKISSSEKIALEDLEAFYSVLASKKITTMLKQKDLIDWLKTEDAVDRTRQEFNISLDAQGKILKHIGIESGLIKDASVQQLKEYSSFLDRGNFTKTPQKKDWIQEAVEFNLLSEKEASEFMNIWESTGVGLPVQSVLNRIGMGKIADKLYNHSVKEQRHNGRGVEFENNIAAILQTSGVKTKEKDIGIYQLIRGQSKFKKISDMFYLFDDVRRLERIENGLLNSKEKKFVAQSFENNGKGGVIKGSVAELIKNEIDALNKFYRTELEAVVKENMNDAQFETWKKENRPEWIEQGVYIHRGLTREFKDIYRPDSRALDNMVIAEGRRLAAKMAKDNNPGATKSELKSIAKGLLPEAEEMARAQMHDRFNFSSGRFQSKFLMKRHEKLPEMWFSAQKGKEIQVYETSYDKTIKKYTIGMSKMLANIEFFPEHVKLKGLHMPGTKHSIDKLIGLSKKWGTYTKNVVESQLGIGKHSNIFEKFDSNLRNYANFLARTQLSFPTSGLKNLGIGTYQSLWAFKLRHMGSAVLGAFDREARANIRRRGTTEVGLRHIDTYDGIFKNALDKGFRFGLMRPTENINRYLAVLAGRADQNMLVRKIRSLQSGRRYNKAVSRLKEFYRLSDDDIKLIKEYGMAGTEGIPMDAINRMSVSRKLNHVYDKMDASSHIYTQGATVELFVPYWAGKGAAKPLTLFKRMAYTASINTFNNTRVAFQQGDMMKITFGLLGAYATGEMLMGVYDKVLGQAKPNQNSGWWDRIMIAMFKGELLGIFSEWFNPYGENKFEHSITPAIYNHAKTTLDAVLSSPLPIIGKDTRTYQQSINQWLKGTVSSYNQGIKILERTNNERNRKYIKYNSKSKEWHKEYNPKVKTKVYNDYIRTEDTKYFQDLKTIWNLGKDDKFARQYLLTFFALYTDYRRRGEKIEGGKSPTHEQAVDYVTGRLSDYMKYLNPNKHTFISLTGKKKLETLEKSESFLLFLTEAERKELLAAEKEYFHRYAKFFHRNGNMRQPHLDKLNVKEIRSKFDWK